MCASNLESRGITAAALDVGRARIGVAVTDPRGEQALAHSVIERKGTRVDIARLLPLLERLQIALVVVGLPPEQPNRPGTAHLAKQFAQALANTQPRPVVLVDEADTTVQANAELQLLGARAAKRRQDIDRHAAKIILDRWLAGEPCWPVEPDAQVDLG